MKAGELFVDSEAKKAAFAYATEVCEYNDEIEAIHDAFIAGVAWKQFKGTEDAKKMAEHKDKLLMERLDLEIEKANTYYDKKLSPYRLANHIGAITAITEILGIPFPTDRLHMGFATMD